MGGVEEVTGILDSAPDVTTAVRHINGLAGIIALDGHSDYGMMQESFWDRWGQQLGARTRGEDLD